MAAAAEKFLGEIFASMRLSVALHVEDRARRRIRAVQGNAETHGGKDLAEEFLSSAARAARRRSCR